MSHQTAASVISLPLDEVEERLHDVQTWPLFLEDLEEISKAGHHRYRMVIRSGRTTREVVAAITHHHREHRFTWKALEGPMYEGEIRLHAEGEKQTKIKLQFTADPVGFMSGLAELFGSRNDTAEIDLRKMEQVLRHDHDLEHEVEKDAEHELEHGH
ncbi:MAG: SRPBCC family protein [Kineosporiaceae bacterium]|nr:SRPBCC family protein [Kineosporiaceae bacterium]MBK8074621.1 SRPBCC family protein [Kineosporiaceae bacterium]